MLKHATQNQIDSDAYSVVGYDHLDRTVYTGEWKTDRDSAAVRAYFNDVQNQNNPVVDSLTPGTVTRTFYDRVPTDDTLNALNVKLVPDGETLKYTRGRVAAVVSDVKAVLDDNGAPVPASNGKDSVIRVSTASSYDKYGRVVKAYAYDPTMPADSLKMLAVETEYGVGGKVLSTTKYPYGLKPNGMNRKITERYVYDRLGRVSDVYSKNGSGNKVPVAHYDYYPTGSVRTVKFGNSLTLSYTYHISGAVKTAEVRSADNRELYADTLYYEDCGNNACTPQYNGNISRMAHHLAHENNNYGEFRDVRYTYDELNRLTKVDDSKQDVFDEMFAYDAQGRITAQRRAGNVVNPTGGEYSYYSGKNRLKSVADNMGGTADERTMSDTANFVYDSEGNLTEDRSKGLKISYDWRGMPVEFRLEPTGSSSDTARLSMMYDGSGRRISKTFLTKSATAASWDTVKVTHYTDIGTEIRENYAGPTKQTKVVVNMPQGLGRYGIEDAENPDMGSGVGYIPNTKFEWYLKNHLGSTMLVYGTQADANPAHSDIGTPLAAYDYRAFGEQVNLVSSNNGVDKVTENFTGKELDDEIALNYFGARYLDPMLALWISVDPKRQYYNSYLYANNNPVVRVDPDGNQDGLAAMIRGQFFREQQINTVAALKGVQKSVVNAVNTVGTKTKEGILYATPSVNFVEMAVPFMAVALGMTVPIELLIGFATFNAVSSYLQYGSTGAAISFSIDAAFIAMDVLPLTPGIRVADYMLDGPMKRAASSALEIGANFVSHKVVDLLLSGGSPASAPDFYPAEKSSSMAPMEDY